MKKIRGPTIANSRRSNRSFCLDIGDAVELKIFKESEIKKMVGAFKIENIHTIEEIIESDREFCTFRYM